MADFVAKRRLVVDLIVILAGILVITYALQIWSSYRYLSSHIEERATSALNQHIGAIWRFHDAQFTHSQATAKLIASQFQQNWALADQDRLVERFDQLYDSKANGETLLRPAYRDYKRHPSSGAPAEAMSSVLARRGSTASVWSSTASTSRSATTRRPFALAPSCASS